MGKFYHYTTTQGFESIIKNKCIRMTRSDFLNDPHDCRVFFDIVEAYSAEKMNLLDYKQAEYAYFVRTTDSEEQVKAVFDNPALIKIKEVTGETAFVTAKMKEETYLEKAKQLSGIKQMIRVD